MLKKNNLILICATVFGITLILVAFFLIFNEVKPAKEFCNSINETYSFSNLGHECNEIPIYQYTSFLFEKYWDFSPRDDFNINLSE